MIFTRQAMFRYSRQITKAFKLQVAVEDRDAAVLGGLGIVTIHRTLRAVVGPTLYVQAAWAVLAAIWNVAGVYLIGQGLRAPGPTASLGAAALLLGIASLLLTAVSRWPWAYLLGSAAAGLMGLSAVVLDGAGFFAAASGVLACFRWRVMQVGD